ncbi:MAG: hypothetical protein FP814_05355 [Desulfobacterium sp.]|nr:hypothetical protein [Desulfobacteraceae bacterium]MBA3035904.1 hypothetical protein [Desulfobacterium sp.]MBU4036758.1 hypothetical protein [Pseudomonadota bacterium]
MKLHLIILLLISVILFSSAQSRAAGFDLTLQWDENTEPDLATGESPRYKIYYKAGSSGLGIKSNFIGLPSSEPAMGKEGASPVKVTVAKDENPDPWIVQFTLHDLDDAQTYYIAVTALDGSGNESDLSQEISTATPSHNNTGDNDGDGLFDLMDPDDDNDGMPDDWEMEFGLNPLVNDARSDPDSDGVDNISEYREGSDPLYADYAGKAIPIFPANGASNTVLSPVLQLQGYSQIQATTPPFTQTRWQISSSRDFDGSPILLDITSSMAFDEIQVPEFVLKPDTLYFWRAMYIDPSVIGTRWSEISSFRTTNINPLDDHGVYKGQAAASETVDLDDFPGLDTFSAQYRALNTVVGQGMIGMKTPPGVVIEALQSIDPADIPDTLNKPENMTLGLIQFRLTGAMGFQPEISIFFSRDLPENVSWYKHDSINGWMDCADRIEIVGPREMVVTLEDGGPGDADGVANGIIIDPSGFGDALSGAPPVSSSATGEGGCFIGNLLE